ncbi:MAG: hypothetical protein JST30_02150 [Armatimonadetes bacterium]|nr:hypothetical protein [Armatimonadota bacterium]
MGSNPIISTTVLYLATVGRALTGETSAGSQVARSRSGVMIVRPPRSRPVVRS